MHVVYDVSHNIAKVREDIAAQRAYYDASL